MAMIVLWGPDLIQLYNDPYRLMMVTKHPAGKRCAPGRTPAPNDRCAEHRHSHLRRGHSVLIDANDAFLAISGYTREQVERGELTWRFMTPAEHTESSDRHLERLAVTGRIGPYENTSVPTARGRR